MSGPTRTFAPGHFLLELDGAPAGSLRNVQGGGAIADVVSEKPGADHIVHKHVGGVRFEDIVLTCDAGLSKAFYEWLGQTTGSRTVRRSGAVVVAEGAKTVSRLEFTNGLVSRIELPPLDTGAKDPFVLTVKITPETTRHAGGGGSAGSSSAAGKSWLTSAFRVSIDGLEEACKYVSRVEPIAMDWKMTSVRPSAGYRNDAEPTGQVELGNLVVTLPESKAKGFYDWFDDFVLKGNGGQSNERSGTLESGIFTLDFGHLGIAAITRPSEEPGNMTRRTRVEMYCESIRLRATVG